jgi:hypothetical protein
MSADPLSIEALCAGLDIPDWVKRFDHIPGGKVVFGWGTIDQLGEEAAALGASNALLVTDPGLAKTVWVERAVQSLLHEVGAVVVFDQVHENPTTDDVDLCVEVASRGESISLSVSAVDPVWIPPRVPTSFSRTVARCMTTGA